MFFHWLYYSARGLLDSREPSILKRLCDIVNLTEPPEKALEKLVRPIYIDEENGVKGIRSKISHLIINYHLFKILKKI